MSDKPKTKTSIYKPKPVSGFPEWLPEERLVEQRWFDHIRKTFESYGFCNIETPSIEEIDVLLAKGEVDKEIYEINRLHTDEGEKKEGRLALHFDQTVPFARYTAQHFNELVFPFKRYQMQRVWRGERPQMGRMREFYQCDIDVINIDNLPLAFDAEIPAVIYQVLEGLNIGRVQIRISNRKILLGLLEALKIEDTVSVTRIIDKIEKLERAQIEQLLKDEKLNDDQIASIIQLAETKGSVDVIKNIKAENDSMQEGIEELSYVLEHLSHLPNHAVVGDLSIVRGLDYYTGTVYETQLLDVPEFTGSVCSGGRYDDLASQYINKKLPGVGISIGFSRLFDVIRQSRPDLLNIGAKSPTDILLYTEDTAFTAELTQAAQALRARGFNVEQYHTVKKWEKHLKYTEKKQIPFVGYIKQSGTFEVKNMETGEQAQVDPSKWNK